MSIIAAIVLTSNLLVLRSGDRLPIDGRATLDDGRITFRSTNGQLFSLPASEVDLDATRTATTTLTAVPAKDDAPPPLPLKVSEVERKRLIAELEQNHAGKDAPAAPIPEFHASTPQHADDGSEEWSWRNRARGLEEQIRQAKENRDVLEKRAEELKTHIASLLFLGYRPIQFSYDTSVLQSIQEQLPYAELEIRRAERAWDDFRDEARRRGIMPGWLR
jgi:hypothetical protein